MLNVRGAGGHRRPRAVQKRCFCPLKGFLRLSDPPGLQRLSRGLEKLARRLVGASRGSGKRQRGSRAGYRDAQCCLAGPRSRWSAREGRLVGPSRERLRSRTEPSLTPQISCCRSWHGLPFCRGSDFSENHRLRGVSAPSTQLPRQKRLRCGRELSRRNAMPEEPAWVCAASGGRPDAGCAAHRLELTRNRGKMRLESLDGHCRRLYLSLRAQRRVSLG